MPDTIGSRAANRRRLLGLTQRQVADRAGLDQSTVSRVEAGRQGADNRFTVDRLAAALECSPADLARDRVFAPDRQVAAAQAGVAAIRQALIETDPGEFATVDARPIPQVVRDAELAIDLRLRADYAAAARLLPGLLREAHALGGRNAARLYVRLCDAASFLAGYVGAPGEAWLAATRARETAADHGDPVMGGLAEWVMCHAAVGAGANDLAHRWAVRAFDALSPHDGAGDGEATALLGQLRLMAGWTLAAQGRAGDGWPLVGEASVIADRVGDGPWLGLSFGPSNVKLWRVSIETDDGEPGRAVEVAATIDPTPLTRSRRATLLIDWGRALARLRRDQEALGKLLEAERLAPQRVRSAPMVGESARVMLARAGRRELAAGLRGLCQRVGVDIV